MKAMILAAGLGSRLMPLTEKIPKALVEIGGKTLLEIMIVKLIRSGIKDVIINVHHHAGQIKGFLKARDYFDINIMISDERGELLDTGGGIMKAREFLDGHEPFLVHNVDVISDIDLVEFGQAHYQNDSLATLAVSQRKSARYLLFDRELKLCGWNDALTGETKMARNCPDLQQLAFSGIHMIDPALFSILTKDGKFSIIDLYLELAGSFRISGYVHSPNHFFDLGTFEKLASAREHLQRNPGIIS